MAEPFGADLVALTAPDLDLRVQTPRPVTPAGTPTAGLSRAAAMEPGGLCQLLWWVTYRQHRMIVMLETL